MEPHRYHAPGEWGNLLVKAPPVKTEPSPKAAGDDPFDPKPGGWKARNWQYSLQEGISRLPAAGQAIKTDSLSRTVGETTRNSTF